MVLAILKYLIWDFYIVSTLPSSKKIPCEICKHSASWHLIVPDELGLNSPNLGTNFTTFDAFIYLKFKLPQVIVFDECMKCGLTKVKDALLNRPDKNKPTHFYKKLDNLQYLEYLYKKGDKNERN
jgi:hypothetical protein